MDGWAMLRLACSVLGDAVGVGVPGHVHPASPTPLRLAKHPSLQSINASMQACKHAIKKPQGLAATGQAWCFRRRRTTVARGVLTNRLLGQAPRSPQTAASRTLAPHPPNLPLHAALFGPTSFASRLTRAIVQTAMRPVPWLPDPQHAPSIAPIARPLAH